MKQRYGSLRCLTGILLIFLMGVMTILTIPHAEAASPHVVVGDYTFSSEGELRAGEDFNITVTLTNPSAYPVKDLRVIAGGDGTLMLSSITTGVFGDVASGASVTAIYGLTTPADAPGGIYYLGLSFRYSDYNGIEYVETEQIPVRIKGDQAIDNRTHPTVLLEKYETNEDIYAGNEFDLKLGIKNPTALTVKNLRIDLQSMDGSFIPKEGKGSIFIDTLAGGETKELSFRMQAVTGLQMKTYEETLSIGYEDERGNGYSMTAAAYLPVKLVAKAELLNFSCISNNLVMGADAEYIGTVCNTGDADIYRATLKIGGTNLKNREVFLGNIPAGTSKNADIITTAISTESSIMNSITLTYEDVDGNVYTTKKELGYVSVFVTDYDSLLTLKNDPNTSDTWRAVLITVLVMLALTGIIVWFILHNRKKKRISADYT